MPDKNTTVSRATINKMNKIAANIQRSMDGLYKSTYYSTPQANKDLAALTKKINTNLDRISDRNLQTLGYSNISRLYDRLPSRDMTKGNPMQNLQQMFEDPLAMDDLYASFTSTKFLRELDQEIDTICKYMPSLQEALNVKKDNVLSADYFSKDFLTIRSNSATQDDSFNERCKQLKKDYNLLTLIEQLYDDAAKYGEAYLYCVPYKTAIEKLLDDKDQQISSTDGMPLNGFGNYRESVTSQYGNHNTEVYNLEASSSGIKIIDESTNSTVVTEAAGTYISSKGYDGKEFSSPKSINLFNGQEKLDLKVEICRSGIIESAVLDYKISHEQKHILSETYSLTESYRVMKEQSLSEGIGDEVTGNMSLGNRDQNTLSTDGLIGHSNTRSNTRSNKNTIKIPGCVVKQLRRDTIKPIYIDDVCMGYYHLELRQNDYDEQFAAMNSTLANPLTSNLKSGDQNFGNVLDASRQDEIIRYIAGQLSKFIDKQFVNNNQDLRKEIYTILKYNDIFNSTSIDRIKVTYIAPEDIIHIFFKQNKETKRGVSDLDKSLIPATIYCSLYLTDSIGTMTRGQDKRVYYVRQNVEQNIAKTMLATIAQIKQGNFGARQFQSVNNMLNITGRFNDYIIPMSPSGDYPIQFEIMPGQQFEPKTDLLDRLENMAINSTDVPKEIVETRMNSIDYATQLSMSSSKFLRYLYNRQSRYQEFCTIIVSKIYNYEYEENITIDVSLPPPSFLNVTNSSQLINNTSELAKSIVDNDLANEDDKVKAEAQKLLFRHYIGSHLDCATHDEIYDKARINVKTRTDKDNNDEY